MDLNYLRDILDDLRFRFACKFQSNSFQLQRQLSVLNQLEKQLIRKKILECEYDVGTLNVIKILKTAGILNITDFLVKANNDELVQAILTDILDLPEMKDLLLEIVVNENQVETIKSNFAQCFSQYVADVLDHPELIKNEFICNIHRQLDVSKFWNSIGQSFFEELLSRSQDTNELTKILGCQSSWNKQFRGKKLELVTKIIQLLCSEHSTPILKMLLPQLVGNAKVNWFYTLMIIDQLGRDEKIGEELKKFTRTSFKKFHESRNVDHFIVVLMIARQLYHYSQIEKPSYQAWVKSTIGEMHYMLKDQEKFGFALETLENLVSYESDPAILDVHAKVAISAPRGVNNRVLEYKMMLKTKSAGLTAVPEVFMDLT